MITAISTSSHQHLTSAFAYVLAGISIHGCYTHTENKFSSCSIDRFIMMNRMMNRTLSRALITWKQRTTLNKIKQHTELDAAEWRRMKAIQAKAHHFSRFTQLKRSLVVWKTNKLQDKGSRLQDRLQDRHTLALSRPRRTPLGQDPMIACKRRLSAPEWLIMPGSASNSPRANLRNAFARIHKSRNAYQVFKTLRLCVIYYVSK